MNDIVDENLFNCSDDRFKLLFRALDGPDGDGKIPEEALQEFLFPGSTLVPKLSPTAIPEEEEDDNNTYELPPI